MVLGNPGWLPAVAATCAGFLLLLAIATFSATLPFRWKLLLFSLKGTTLLLLGVCLLDPQWTRSHAKPGENIVVLLADASASMNVRPSAASSYSRADATRELLQDSESRWQIRLAQDFELRRYTFGSRLTRSEDFHDLAFEDSESNLLAALRTLEDRFAQQPLAAVLAFTDGLATDRARLSQFPAGVPVYPIIDDDAVPPMDLAIGSVVVSESNFEDAPLTLQATIVSNTPLDVPVKMTLAPLDSPGDAAAQTLTLRPERNRDPVARFQVKPAGTGPAFYRLRVMRADEPDAFDRPGGSREATLANNERLLVFNRDPRPFRILYVGGRPNWEHKFLSRALTGDPLLQLVGLLRIAKKEARFDFRGRAGDGSNSLFRGFKEDADEETEAYDEPVLIRLNTRDEAELSDGFPKSREELFQYEALILDDVEAEFFTRDQLTLIDRYVSERGGGLLMLGGRDSYRHGNWHRTPVADALPVYLDRAPEPVGYNLRWGLTREGWLEPWLRLRDSESQEQARLQDAAALEMLNVTGHVKPGARVLADVEDASGNRYPAFVSQQYGRGRAAALLLGDLWKWSLRRDENHPEDAEKLWRQLARWLTGDVPRRLEASVGDTFAGQLPATAIRIRVRDRALQPASDGRVEISLTQPDGSVLQLDAPPSLQEAGLYEAVHVSRQPGAYLAQIVAHGPADDAPQRTAVGWTSDPAAKEFERTAIDRNLLQELAERSGGEVIPQRQLDEFVSTLGYRAMPVTEIEATPLWHRAWLLTAVLTLLAAEWGLRRMRGLP